MSTHSAPQSHTFPQENDPANAPVDVNVGANREQGITAHAQVDIRQGTAGQIDVLMAPSEVEKLVRELTNEQVDLLLRFCNGLLSYKDLLSLPNADRVHELVYLTTKQIGAKDEKDQEKVRDVVLQFLVKESPHVREMHLDKDMFAFPHNMRGLVRVLRQLSHSQYIALVDLCKHQHVLFQNRAPADQHYAERIVALAMTLNGNKPNEATADILRLLRTEKLDDGYDVLENMPDRGAYPAARKLFITLMSGKRYLFTVRPDPNSEDTSIVENEEFGSVLLGAGQTVTLGRGSLALPEVLGRKLNQSRTAQCDLALAHWSDTGLSRACVKVTRTKEGTIVISESGATTVTEILVDEREKDLTLSSLSFRPDTGVSKVL